MRKLTWEFKKSQWTRRTQWSKKQGGWVFPKMAPKHLDEWPLRTSPSLIVKFNSKKASLKTIWYKSYWVWVRKREEEFEAWFWLIMWGIFTSTNISMLKNEYWSDYLRIVSKSGMSIWIMELSTRVSFKQFWDSARPWVFHLQLVTGYQ